MAEEIITEPEFGAEVLPDTNHKFTEPGDGGRTFSILENPIEKDGQILYTLHEKILDAQDKPVLTNVPVEDVEAFVLKNGTWAK